MPNGSTRPSSSPVPDPRLASVQHALALLTRQPILLAVTLHSTVAEQEYDITVSKAVDDAGTVQPGFWWEVTRLARDALGQPHQGQRWQQGLRAYETAEEAYLAALHWVEHQASH